MHSRPFVCLYKFCVCSCGYLHCFNAHLFSQTLMLLTERGQVKGTVSAFLHLLGFELCIFSLLFNIYSFIS